MKLADWLAVLSAHLKQQHGFERSEHTERQARREAGSVYPLDLFREWLIRCPEALDFWNASPLASVDAGVRGASRESVPSDRPGPDGRVVRTRIVTPFDLKKQVDSDIAASRKEGQDATMIGLIGELSDDAGVIVVHYKRDPNGQTKSATIWDVAGPAIMVRNQVGTEAIGLHHIDPSERARVDAAVRRHPRWCEAGEFNPWDGDADPWA